ncbi:peptidoglycan-binding protein [Garciella nitratireducens]|uniref:C40 family peptidase n=2 Tax=Garciella nitratireducens TaxID=218205 RepID=UPI000DE9D927|nr:peptidoglycan-binding protein [Garciella nitratireducens]RBP39898.1 cell wall-associated NlpC family hydrolase [Garciella nitratireducens]
MKKSLKIFTVLTLLLITFTGSAFAQGLLGYGMAGSNVKNLQNDLHTLGYPIIWIDGIFGQNTKDAVMNFQKDNNLSADGIAGPNTFAALEKNLGTSSTNSSTLDRLLKYGTRGEDVRNLQNTLNSLGYNAGSADGIFGKNTKNAVMSFQKNNNLSADGIVGPATLSKLNSTSSISKETSNRGSVASRSIIEKVIATAQSYLGVPYVWGGTSPSGFDCSGFTYYVLKQYGISIPRTSTAQYTQGTPVSKSNLQRGDFVFFNTSGSGVSHVGIYLGNNTFISATSSKGIAICSLNNSYWSPRYIGARRILY